MRISWVATFSRLLFACCFVLQQTPAWAESVNFNLGSTQAVLHTATAHPIRIVVAGKPEIVSSTTALTPAELVAVTQVLNTGRQTVVINRVGAAVGGSVSLTRDLGSNALNVSIPHGVKGLVNFLNTPSVAIPGSLTNAGSIYAYSSNLFSNSAGIISAQSILNEAGGLIAATQPRFQLTLSAQESLINNGTVRTAGSLILVAPSITNNTISPRHRAIITGHDLNVIANNLTNAGVLAATAGDINFHSVNNLTIDNANGTLRAARDITFTEFNNISLTGGNVFSKHLNADVSGAANIFVDEITAQVNITACKASVAANTPNLKLGTLNLHGDPTFFNTGGNLVLTGAITTNGGDLALLASGNVVHSGGAIDTSSATGNGGNILIGAGMALTANPTHTGQTNNDTSTIITTTGGNATGGNIDLSGTSYISSQALNATGNGGNVLLYAFPDGISGNTGHITAPMFIRTGTNSSGTPGFVRIVGGSTTGNDIVVGSIDATTVSGAGSGVSILSSAPTSFGGTVTVVNGTPSPTFAFQASAIRGGSIEVGSINSSGQSIIIQGGTIKLDGSISNAAVSGANNLINIAGSSIQANGIGISASGQTFGGVIVLKANSLTLGPSTMTLSATGSNGGSVQIAANSISVGPSSIDVSASGGNGGSIGINPTNMTASPGSVSLTQTSFNVSGAGNGNGGTFYLSSTNAVNNVSVTANGGGGGGNGGSITVDNVVSLSAVANGGGIGNGGNISVSGGATVGSLSATAGPSGGNGGNITASGGINFPSPAQVSVSAPNGTAGSITIDGGLASNGGSITADSGAPASHGGSISITGSISPGNMNLSANGQALGGSVSLTSSDSYLTVGGAGGMTVSAKGALPGTVNISGNGLRVDTSGIDAKGTDSNASGATVTFQSGAGPMDITGPLSVDGMGSGHGGSLSILANSTSPISINSSSVSANAGVTGTAAGFIQITNQGTGGIDIQTSSLSAQTTNGMTGSIGLSAPNGTVQISSPVVANYVSITTANNATTGSSVNPVLVNNGGHGLNLFVQGGGFYLTDTTNESVALINTSATPLTAAASFVLNTNGSVFAATPFSTAIRSPVVSVTAVGGSITANGTAPLMVSSGGPSGLSLFANATQVSGIGGIVRITDNMSENLILDNSAGPSNAASSFVLTANGNIAANTPISAAITSPNISLTATGGNIGGNASASIPLLLSSGGSSGLTLFANASKVSANGGTVNIGNSTAEDVTLLNSTIPLIGAVAFSLSATGNIVVSDQGRFAIASPNIYLTTSAGNIAGDAIATNPLRIASGYTTGLSLFANADSAAGSGGTVNITDATNEAVTLSNAANPLNASVAFALAANGNIFASSPGSSAITSSSISLAASGGNIGGNAVASSPLLLSSGGTAGLSLFAQSTRVTATGGTINIADANGEIITLANGAAPLQAAVSFTLSSQSSIVAASAGLAAISSPSISLTAVGGNVGGNLTASVPLLISSGGSASLNLYFNATQSGGLGGEVNISDTAVETVNLTDGTSSSNGLTLFSAGGFTAAGSISAGGSINITALGTDTMTSAFPSDLDLSETSPLVTIPALSPWWLLVNPGSSVQSTGGSIVINGQTQVSNILGPGTYGSPSYPSVTISGGPSGTLTITPTTLVTPAEWVAAVQVATTSSQPLTIGTDNAASGGSLTITGTSLPAASFSNIFIPSAVTANVAVPTLTTNKLVNNGTLQPSGGQTSLVISSSTTNSGNLEIGGIGAFSTPSGTLTLQAGTNASNSITFDDGSNLALLSSSAQFYKFMIFAPNIVVGSTGTAQAILTANGPFLVMPSQSGNGALTFTAAGTGSALHLNGSTVLTISSLTTTVGTNFTFAGDTSIYIEGSASGIVGQPGGLIVSPTITLQVGSGNIGGDAAATSPLMVSSGSSTNLNLTITAAAFGTNANVADQTNDVVTLKTSTVYNLLSVSSATTINVAGAVQSLNGNVILNAIGTAGIASTFPSGLDLSAQNPNLTIPAIGGPVVFISNPNYVASCGTITINGQVQPTQSLLVGSYGTGQYSITINGGPSGSLTITPFTPVTPAEWVAAIQVQNNSNQSLTIGPSNNAIGGSFNIDAVNVPAVGFTSIIVPNSVTANVSVASLQTNTLINNGTIQVAGPQTNLLVTSVGASTGNLTVAGTGNWNTSNGALTLETANGLSNTLTFGATTNMAVTGSVVIDAPTIVLGSAGGASVAITTNGGAILIQPNSSAAGALALTTGGTSAVLQLNGGAVIIPTTTGATVGANVTLAAGTSVAFQNSGAGNVVTGAGALIASPIISVSTTNGNIGTSGAQPLSISSNPSTAGLVLLKASASGSVWITDGLSHDSVKLDNSSTPLTGGTSFNLATAGDIFPSTQLNFAITSPSISITTTAGNIGGDAGATSWLLLRSGGTSGLSVFASSTQMGGNGGNINIGAGELLTIDNSTGPLFASASVTLTDGLGIVAKNSATTAIASPTISLTSSGASFGISASQPLPIASGTLVPGTVTLFVDACGSAWLTDVLPGDAVKIDNSSTPSEALGGVGIFSLVTAGNIFASTPSNTAIVSQTISLVTTGGNIGGNAAATSPLLVTFYGNGVDLINLYTSAIRANGTGGIINLGDPMSPETVVLLNDSAPLKASVSFSLSINGYIAPSSPNATAITSPNILLFTTRYNISADWYGSSPLLLNSGGTSGLTLFANGSGGSVNIADRNNETVTLANTTSPLGADWKFSLDATGNIMASSVGNTAIASPNIVLTATGGNIGGNASASNPLLVNSSGTVPNLTLFINAIQAGGNGGTVNLSDTNTEDVVVSNSANPLNAAVAFTLSVNGNILPTVGANVAITSPTISLTAAGGNIGGNAAATIPLLLNSGSTSGLNLYASANQVSGNGGNVNIEDTNLEEMTLSNGTSASNSLQLTAATAFTVAGAVSAGSNIILTTLSSQTVLDVFPANLDLSLTTPTLTMPASSSIDVTVNAGGQISSAGGSISINGHSQPNPVGPGTYSAPNYSITISGGPTGTLTITPTTLVTPAEWVAAIQVQDSSAQPLNIGTNNAASGGSFALTAANVPAGGFTNIVIPATTPGTTMTVSTPVQTNFLTNNGTIQGSVLQIFSNGNLSIGGAGTIQSTYGTTIQSGASNDVNFTGGTLTFLGATEVFSGTGRLNQIFLQTGSGFRGADAVTLYSDKVAGDTSNISGNPLKIVPYSGTGTIANPNGDVFLPSNLIFAGKDLAILASGNIKAKSTVTSINLSALTGNGGSLIMVAGFDFQDTSVPTTTLDSLFKTPNHDTWTITGPSASGGSVLLPRVAINTTSANGNAGNITVVAHAGNSSTGTIQLGSITATANTKTGVGGSVTLIGQGGVQTGFIKTSGAIGNSVTIEAATPTLGAGSVEIVDGDRVGPGFTWLTPIVTDGGAILVSGLVNTAGSNGRGGDILMQADHQVQVKGTISATGLLTPNNLVGDAGGDIQIQSFLSSITISGSINTSALSLKTAVGTAAGNAGSMYINAESYISTGSLLAKGANNLAVGSGGTGGNILLTTNMITGTATPADGFRFGNVKVNGYITVQGGSVSATLGDMNSTGGNSGGVAVDAGTFIVTSNTGGISINDRPGSGRQPSNNGTVGGVDIHTYGIQQLPARFDLTSTLDNIASLPGGMFTVGLTAPINGTQGSIAVDSLTVGSDNFTNKLSTGGGPLDGQITQNTMNGGATIRVHITGPASAFLFAPVVFPSGKRGILNPSQAVAEFQSDRGQTPITLLNQVASAGTIAVDQSDTNGTTFTAFKLPAGVTLSVTGIMPIFNMPASTLIKGTLNFATTGSVDYINLGTGALMIGSSGATLTPTATIDASNSTLILSGTASTWTNNANLIAGTLVLARPTTSALTFVTGLGASTQASQILLGPDLDTSMSMTFKSNGAAQWNTGGATPQPIPVVFGSVGAPTAYQPNAAANGLNTALPLIKLTFALSEKSGNTLVPLTATVGGQIRGSSITISGAASTVVLSGVTHTVQTPLSIADGANLTSAGTLTVSTPAGITVGNSTQITAGTALYLNAGNVLALGNGNILTAGSLSSNATPYGTGVLLGSQIVKNGTIILSGSGSTGNNGVVIGNNNQLNEMGSKLNITAKLGNLQIGDSNLFLDRGGNVIVLAKGNISGGTANSFESQGVLNTATGGVEIGAGTTGSAIATAFSKPAGTRLGIGNIQGISDLFPTHGAIVLNPVSSTGVNMASGGTPNMSIDLGNGGVAVFDAQGNSTVQMQSGGIIQTQASKPVSLVLQVEPEREFVVDTDVDAI